MCDKRYVTLSALNEKFGFSFTRKRGSSMKKNFASTFTSFNSLFANMVNRITEEKALRIVLSNLGYSEEEIQYSSVRGTTGEKVYDVKVIADGEAYYYTIDMTTGKCSLKNIVFA